MNSKISVIIPIYNVEKYLNRCVDSVINQTYKNLEIILVDDGSPDNCGAICDEYAKKDARVKVIHKKNGGLSSARNAGLDVMTGEYVTFIDSDDWIEKDLLNIEYDYIVSNNVDLVKPLFKYDEENFNEIFNDKIRINDSYELFKSICLRKDETSVCGTLWKKLLFDKERFQEGILNEDFLFCANMFLKNKLRILYTKYKGYTYFSRPGSISKQGFGKSSIDAVYNTKKSIEIAKEFCPKLEKYCRGYNAYQARTALIIMPNAYRNAHKDFEGFCVDCLRENMKNAYFKQFKLKDIIFCKLYIKNSNCALKLLGKKG